MRKQGESLANQPILGLFVVFSRFDGFWLVDLHGYWARDCEFEMQMHTNRWLIKTLVGWHIVDVLALPTRDHLATYLPVPD